MIPPPDVVLSSAEQRRWELTKAACALVESGVPVDLVMADAREGCDLALGEQARGKASKGNR